MGFTVHLQNGTSDQYGDKSLYKFTEGGLLTVEVVKGDGEKTLVRHFSPTGWLELTADTDHGPGRPKREGEGRTRSSRAVFG